VVFTALDYQIIRTGFKLYQEPSKVVLEYCSKQTEGRFKIDVGKQQASCLIVPLNLVHLIASSI